MQDRPVGLLRFGSFELDPGNGELRRSGARIKIHAQPLKLLTLLASRSGETVERDEIRRHVWSDSTHVDFDQGINACIRQIRAALGDSAESPRFIQTVPRRGYRFVAPVESFAPTAEVPEVRSVSRGRMVLSSLIVLLVAASWVTWSRLGSQSDAAGERSGVLVLPFKSLGAAADDDALGDAMTEELIARLGGRYSRRLSVIARTSAARYAGTDKSLDTIAEELGVQYVVEGSVQREGDRVRVTAQLIETERQSQLWAEVYDRDLAALLDLQRELADQIAHNLAIELLPADSGRVPVPDRAAYEAYLMGRHHLSKGDPESLRAGIEQFENAIALDPEFARPFVGLARATKLSVLPPEGTRLAREALGRALELDDSLAEAHLALARIRFYTDYDLEGARRSFERAIEINPGYAEAHHQFSAYYSVNGRHDEAIASIQRARRLDPVSADVNSDVGWYYYFARRYDEAIEHSRITLELEPDFYWSRLCVQLALHQTGDLERAVEYARESLTRRERMTDELRSLEHDPERFMRAYWRQWVEGVRAVARERFIPPDSVAQMLMALNETEEALEALERSYEMRTGWTLPFLRVDPLYDSLREDGRFDNLIARVDRASG